MRRENNHEWNEKVKDLRQCYHELAKERGSLHEELTLLWVEQRMMRLVGNSRGGSVGPVGEV
jgi:hypothetical protein